MCWIVSKIQLTCKLQLLFEWLLRNIWPHIIHRFTKRLISIGFIPLTEQKKNHSLAIYLQQCYFHWSWITVYWFVFTHKTPILYLFQSIFILYEILHQELVYVTLVLIKLDFRDSDYPSRANNLMISCLPLNLILYYGYFVLSFLYCRLSLKMSRSGQSKAHWSMYKDIGMAFSLASFLLPVEH